MLTPRLNADTPKRRYAHTALTTQRLLLLLERPVYESSFQQPKNKTDDRVEEELIKINPKSRGEHWPAILQG